MMKFNKVTAGMALTGALLASASVAKASAYMELISGTSTVTVGNNVALGPDGAQYVGSVGSWTVDIATGTGSGSGGLTVNLQDQNVNLPPPYGGPQSAGLEIIYSSGTYSVNGTYVLSSSAASDSLPATAAAYYSSTLGGTTTQIGTTMSLLAGTYSTQQTGTISLVNKYITDVLIFGSPAAGSVSPATSLNINLSESLKVTSVPDGGMTASMIGAAFLGLAGLRSKFGKKS